MKMKARILSALCILLFLLVSCIDKNITPSQTDKPVLSEQVEEVFVDTSQKNLPDFETYLSCTPDFDSEYGERRAVKFYWISIDLMEDLKKEIEELLLEKQYQLKLTSVEESEYYTTPVQHYLYSYTGDSEEIAEIEDDYGLGYLADVMVRFNADTDGKYFSLHFYFDKDFDLTLPSHQTLQNVRDVALDPSSKLLPDIEAFVYHEASTRRGFYSDGLIREWNGSMPAVAYETVRDEILSLLLSDKYQLELVQDGKNPRYAIDMHDYYFSYTGTSDEITGLVDEKDGIEFDVRFRISLYPEYDYFKMSIAFHKNFDVEDPIVRTSRDITENGEGGIITTPPEASGDDGNDFFKKCSACHGSGDCTHCGGDDEVKKFQAGLGWVEQNCTFCTRGKCRHCNGTGKD